MAITQRYQPIEKDAWIDHVPTKDQFQSANLDIQNLRFEFHREPGSGGANEAQDFFVPSGNVLVGWSSNETSCINCGGGDYQLIMQDNGIFSIPIGIRPGSRLEPGEIFGSGAYFTGDLTLISVPRSVWVPVAMSMVPTP